MQKIMILFLLLCSGTAFGQLADTLCNNKDEFLMFAAEAKKALKEQKCVLIDASSSYDSISADIQFKWNLGDGNHATGLKVKHCYNDFGTYQATMDILTNTDEILTHNEMVLDIFIKEPVEITLMVPDTLQINEIFAPHWEVTTLFTYRQKQILFDFGDGHYGCEHHLEHMYKKPGHYTITMLMVLDHDDGEEVTVFTKKKVLIEGSNIDGKTLHAYFDQYLDTPAVDYLKEPVQVYLLDNQQESILKRELHPDDQIYLSVPNDKTATLFIWRAHQLMKPIDIPQGADSVSSDYILSKVEENMSIEPLYLKSMYFNLNEVTLNQRNKNLLKENIKLLNILPSPVIKVGSYTHTGGMRGIAEKFAMDRSMYLSAEIDNSIKENVEIIVEPVSQITTLLNTCFDNPQCGQEVKYLNGRSDLKIIAIGKD